MNTNILTITFDASTIEGIIAKNLIYKPSMSNPVLYKSFPNILFIPTIRLSNGLFERNLGEDDIKKIFLSPSQFNNFISKIKTNIKPLTINEAKQKGIIYNNIKFILNLFFKKNDALTLNNQSFIINNYKWDNKYNLKSVNNNKAPNVSINISFILHKGSSMTFTESTRLNCMQKKQEILEEYYNLAGLDKPKQQIAKSGVTTIPKESTANNKKPTTTTNKPKKMTERTYYYGGIKHKYTKKNKKV